MNFQRAAISAIMVTTIICVGQMWAISRPTTLVTQDGKPIAAAELTALAEQMKLTLTRELLTISTPQALDAESSDALNIVVKTWAWTQLNTSAARAWDPASTITQAVLERELSGNLANRIRDLAGMRVLAEADTTLLRRAFESRPEAFNPPPGREVFYIFKSLENKSPADEGILKSELESVRESLMNNSLSFERAAERHSEAPSATRGGSIGIVPPDTKMRKEFRDLIFSLPVGKVSPVTRLSNGLYIVKVAAEIQKQNVTFDQIMETSSGRSILATIATDLYLQDLATTAEAKASGKSTLEQQRVALGSILGQKESLEDAERAAKIVNDWRLSIEYARAKSQKECAPTEKAVQEFYRDKPEQVRESGLFKFTRYELSARRTTDSVVRSPAAAQNQLREWLNTSPKPSDADLQKRGVTITQFDTWTQSTDAGDVDFELLKIAPGQLTSVVTTRNGAVAFRLRERRTPPPLAFEKAKPYIENYLRAECFDAKVRAESEAAVTKLKIRRIWQEPAAQ